MADKLSQLDYLTIYFNALENYTNDPTYGAFYQEASYQGQQLKNDAATVLGGAYIKESGNFDLIKKIDIYIDFLQQAINQAKATERRYLEKMRAFLQQMSEDKTFPKSLYERLEAICISLEKGREIDYFDIITAINALKINQHNQEEYRYNQAMMMQHLDAYESSMAANDKYAQTLKKVLRRGPQEDPTKINPKTQKPEIITWRDVVRQIYSDRIPSGQIRQTYNSLIIQRLNTIVNAVLKRPEFFYKYINVNLPASQWDFSQLIADIEAWLRQQPNIKDQSAKTLVDSYFKWLNNNNMIKGNAAFAQKAFKQQRATARATPTIERALLKSTDDQQVREIMELYKGDPQVRRILDDYDNNLKLAETSYELAALAYDLLTKMTINPNKTQKRQITAAKRALQQAQKALEAQKNFRKQVLILIMQQSQTAIQPSATLAQLRTKFQSLIKDGAYFNATRDWLEKTKTSITATPNGEFAEYSIADRVERAFKTKALAIVEGKNIQLKGDLIIGEVAPDISDLFDKLNQHTQQQLLSTLHDALAAQKVETGGTGEINVATQHQQLIETLRKKRDLLNTAKKADTGEELTPEEQQQILQGLLLQEVSIKDYSTGAEAIGVDAGSLGKDLDTTIDNFLKIYNLGGADLSTDAKEKLIFAVRNSSSTAMAGSLITSLKLYLITAAIFVIFDFGFADLPIALKKMEENLGINEINILNLVNVDGRFYPSSFVYFGVLSNIKKVRNAIQDKLDIEQYLTSINIIGAPKIGDIDSSLPPAERWQKLRNAEVTIELHFLAGLGNVLNYVESIFGNSPIY